MQLPIVAFLYDFDKTLLPAEGVDPPEPILHSGKEHNAPALFHQIRPGEGHPLLLRLPDHGVHIGQDAVDPVAASKVVGLSLIHIW